MDPVEFVQAMLQAGAGGSFDALSYPPYDETAQFSDGNTTAPWASDTAYNRIKNTLGHLVCGNRSGVGGMSARSSSTPGRTTFRWCQHGPQQVGLW
jgi:hypothetical protein